NTIEEILNRHGIEPAPERSRKTTWKEFLSPALGVDCGRRLLHHRGVDKTRAAAGCRAVLYGDSDTEGRDCRYCYCRQWAVDEPDRQESDRRCGRNPGWQALLDPWPRSFIYR